MSSKLLSRMEKNAQYLIEHYKSANDLLKQAVRDSMPWAMPLAMNNSIPPLPNIERLATQLLAILIASEPDDKPVAGYIRDLDK